MTKGLTTVVVIGYHQTPISAHMTMACLANITKYTDPEDYELFLVEDIPKFRVRDDYHVLKIDKHTIYDEYTNFSVKVNNAVKEANGEYIAIIQNDCFVYEGWLQNSRYYLEKDMADAIVPDQFPNTRQHILDSAAMSMEDGFNGAARDACMMYLRKSSFDDAGGYNPDIKALVEGDFYVRLENAGVRLHTTNKVQVTHITLATHYQDMDKFNADMTNDSLVKDRLG